MLLLLHDHNTMCRARLHLKFQTLILSLNHLVSLNLAHKHYDETPVS